MIFINASLRFFIPNRIMKILEGVSFVGKEKVAEVIENNETNESEDWEFIHLMTACIMTFTTLIILITYGVYLLFKKCKGTTNSG